MEVRFEPRLEGGARVIKTHRWGRIFLSGGLAGTEAPGWEHISFVRNSKEMKGLIEGNEGEGNERGRQRGARLPEPGRPSEGLDTRVQWRAFIES